MNVINSGRSLARKSGNNGFGSRSTEQPVRLLASPLAAGRRPRPTSCRHPFPACIGNVPPVTRIFGQLTRQSSPPNGTVPLTRRAVRPTISSASTTHCVSGVVGSCALRFRFRKSWPITSVLSGILFTITMPANAPNAISLHVHDYSIPERLHE